MSLTLVVINANEIHQMRCTLHVRIDENAKKKKKEKRKKRKHASKSTLFQFSVSTRVAGGH